MLSKTCQESFYEASASQINWGEKLIANFGSFDKITFLLFLKVVVEESLKNSH